MTRNKIAHSITLCALAISACSTDDVDPFGTDELRSLDIPAGEVLAGERLFDTAFPGTNGRSCGDCHVAADARTLTPEHVQALWASNPHDPLFADIDIDDPASGERTFNNLQHGLARVILKLPDNMDVIDIAGNVITNSSRTIEVWRAVPAIRNTAYTPGFLYDGRASNLEDQARGAIEGHSLNTHAIGRGNLRLIAQFERSQFSSDRARYVADQFADGVPPEEMIDPDDDPTYLASLTPAQQRGKVVYDRACTQCHGGATDNLVTDQAVLQSLCFMPKSDGNLDLDFIDLNGNGVFDFTEFPTLSAAAPAEPCEPFMNLGNTFTTHLGQLGALGPQAFNRTAKFPRYRFRFYTDGTRTQQLTDLPPVPALNPDGTNAVDERGVPIFGPAGAPQFFSTDPGRAGITGKPQDFEAFDVPQLRGIVDTAPYFHDNLSATLEDVVDLYSRAIIPFIPALGLPPIHPPTPSTTPAPFGGESLTAAEKTDRIEFLKVF